MKKFKGFTLTELMIALAVIGVLTAIVIPILLNNAPNRNKMLMKKAYNAIENTVSSLINDQSLYPTINGSVGFANTAEACSGDTELSSCEGLGKFPVLFAGGLNVDGNVSLEHVEAAGSSSAGGGGGGGGGAGGGGGSSQSTITFTTSDGMVWTVSGKKYDTPPAEVSAFDGSHNQIIQTITVDVNGRKRPNCQQGDESCSTRTNGFDRFSVYVMQNGKIVPVSGQTYFIEAISVGSDINGD